MKPFRTITDKYKADHVHDETSYNDVVKILCKVDEVRKLEEAPSSGEAFETVSTCTDIVDFNDVDEDYDEDDEASIKPDSYAHAVSDRSVTSVSKATRIQAVRQKAKQQKAAQEKKKADNKTETKTPKKTGGTVKCTECPYCEVYENLNAYHTTGTTNYVISNEATHATSDATAIA